MRRGRGGAAPLPSLSEGLLAGVLFHVHGEFRAVHVAASVGGNAFRSCGIGSSRVGCGVGHEILYRTVFGAANANAAAAARIVPITGLAIARSEEHTSELQSQSNLVCRL